MSQKVTKNQRRFSGEVPSESVVKARGYRGERHCEKDAFSERRSQEGNRNCNNLQQVERGDDVVESGYFEFQNNQERKEILNQILRNDMISSETKKSCASKLYEVTNKMEHEESDDTLSSKGSNGKNSFPKNKKEILEQNQNNITKPKNINVNSYSKRNQKKKSRKISKSVSSKPERVFRSELGFNNNAEGYSPPKGRKQSSRLEDITVENLDEARRMSKAMQTNSRFPKSTKFNKLNNWFQSLLPFGKRQKREQEDNLLRFDDDIDRLVEHTQYKLDSISERMGNKEESDQMSRLEEKALLDEIKQMSQTLHRNAGFPDSTKFNNLNTWLQILGDPRKQQKRFDKDLNKFEKELYETVDIILIRFQNKEENVLVVNQELVSVLENAQRKIVRMNRNAGFPFSEKLRNLTFWIQGILRKQNPKKHKRDQFGDRLLNKKEDGIVRKIITYPKKETSLKKAERKSASSGFKGREIFTNPTKTLPVRRSNMTKEETEQYERDYNRISKGVPHYLYMDRSKRNYIRAIPEGEDDDDVFE